MELLNVALWRPSGQRGELGGLTQAAVEGEIG